MHENYRDFLIDLDTAKDDEVVFGRTLDVGVKDGVQSFPPAETNDVANRLVVFTGTPVFTLTGPEDGFKRGLFRVRLHYQVSETVRVVGSATTAALASLHGGDEEDGVFAVDGAEVRVGPDGGVGLDPRGLPAEELYLFLDAAILGEESVLSRLSYQANVLVLDTEPDIDRVGIRQSGLGGGFINAAVVEANAKWDIEVVLTALNAGPSPFPYTVSSGDPANVPIDILDSIQQVPPSFQQAATGMRDPVTGPIGSVTTITVTGRRNVRTATIQIAGPR